MVSTANIANPGHPLIQMLSLIGKDFVYWKYKGEIYLRESKIAYTVVRPTVL